MEHTWEKESDMREHHPLLQEAKLPPISIPLTYTLSHSHTFNPHLSLNSLSLSLNSQPTHTHKFDHNLHSRAPIAIPSVATRCSRHSRPAHTNFEGTRKGRIASVRVACNILKEIQARSWVGFGKFWGTVVVTKCLQE
ncbi:hypothetical protein PIB30_103394, partial [Stylosanthes scabra]|nr:hypothetical protein [Stylosanthes scabra]